MLTNQLLVELAAQMPRTKAGLLKVAGIGKKKADRYASAILAAVAANHAVDEIGDDAGSRAELAPISDATDAVEFVGAAAGAGGAMAEPAEMPA